MNKNYQQLIEVKNKFQSKIKNPKLEYTFIAPKEEKQFSNFMAIVERQPTISGSFYEILNNPNKVEELLINNFPISIELDIYYRTNDIFSNLIFEGTLREYIKKEGLNFEY